MKMITCTDVLQWATEYTGPQFHAMLCDPPYELNFMGKQWDKSGIAFNPSTWAALAQHLLPGAFIMAFASARGFHRMAVAIEDAGLIIHPAIFGWAYGSGFPKASRIDTRIDSKEPRKHLFDLFAKHFAEQRKKKEISQKEISKYFPSKTGGLTGCVWNWENGASVPTLEQWKILKPLLELSDEFTPLIERIEAEREVIGNQTKARKTDCGIALPTTGETEYQTWDLTAPATNLAKSWAGHRYGLQALKPALEPIIVAQKPYKGKPVESITQTGAGALWIDGARIGTDSIETHQGSSGSGIYNFNVGDSIKANNYKSSQGRWPANFYTDDEGAQRLDEMSGELHSGAITKDREKTGYILAGHAGKPKYTTRCDESFGGASRFFYRISQQLDEAEQVYYTAKASRSERDEGIHSELVNCGVGALRDSGRGKIARNIHPTVKPIDLCKWLATLLLPPKKYAPRRILIPFAGTGSELIGALHAGWEEPLGIERESEYVQIAQGRINAWKEIQLTLDL